METYTITDRQVVAASADVRVQEMTLSAGESIPWHTHSHVADTFYCLEGELEIETPTAGTFLHASVGASIAIPPHQPHKVASRGPGRCRFVLIQGVGAYDFVPASP